MSASLESAGNEPLRLHIGGKTPRPGWKIFNIQPGPNVDFVGNCMDLGRFVDNSVAAIYASHVFEHLGFARELPLALKECHRVLVVGGAIMISVPDLDRLCRLFTHPQATEQDRLHIMKFMFGAQSDPYDVHRVGLWQPFLAVFLDRAGFSRIERVEEFGLFQDWSSFRFRGVPISLNLRAIKPPAADAEAEASPKVS